MDNLFSKSDIMQVLFIILKKMNKKQIKYILLAIIVLGLLFFIISRFRSNTTIENTQTEKIILQNKIPETINWTIYSLTKEGISFTYPSFWKVERVEDILNIGSIVLKIERISCSDPKPSKAFVNPIKIYGFKTQIDESQQIAYICNNTNTACIDISSNNKKMTEEFYHGFISTLHITEEFEKIQCSSGKNF